MKKLLMALCLFLAVASSVSAAPCPFGDGDWCIESNTVTVQNVETGETETFIVTES